MSNAMIYSSCCRFMVQESDINKNNIDRPNIDILYMPNLKCDRGSGSPNPDRSFYFNAQELLVRHKLYCLSNQAFTLSNGWLLHFRQIFCVYDQNITLCDTHFLCSSSLQPRSAYMHRKDLRANILLK